MWKVVKDFLSGVSSLTNERLRSPFLASFSLAVIIVNYPLTLTLLSIENNTKYKIEYIDNYTFDLGWPLGLSLVYTFLVPLGNVFVTWVLEFINNLKEAFVLHAKKHTPFAKELARDYFKVYDDKMREAQRITSEVLAREKEITESHVQEREELSREMEALSIFSLILDSKSSDHKYVGNMFSEVKNTSFPSTLLEFCAIVNPDNSDALFVGALVDIVNFLEQKLQEEGVAEFVVKQDRTCFEHLQRGYPSTLFLLIMRSLKIIRRSLKPLEMDIYSYETQNGNEFLRRIQQKDYP